MQEISLQAVPSQVTKVVLEGQNCQIFIYQKDAGLFVDLNVNGSDIVTGIIARDMDPVVCREYNLFVGDLIFVDTQGSDDPNYTGLADRFALVYLNEVENGLIQQ